MPPLLVSLVGGTRGAWRVERFETVRGDPLPTVAHIEVVEGLMPPSATKDAAWVLHGVTSHERYVTRADHEALVLHQENLGRASSTHAALIPIKKSERWYELARDERRRIFEERSRHVATGIEYLPAIARRLHHGRDRGEPFDFLTWFEFAPAHAAAFEELVRLFRKTEEWTYIVREIDIRLVR
jgi:chlorite dismutase